MQQENVGFGEALRNLGGYAGIQIINKTFQAGEHEILIRVNEETSIYFRNLLLSDRGAPTREYLKARQVNADSMEMFELGLSPPKNELHQHLTNKGFDIKDLAAAGVVSPSNPVKDTFRNRLMFPIRDANKRLVGFGGRALGQSQPK